MSTTDRLFYSVLRPQSPIIHSFTGSFIHCCLTLLGIADGAEDEVGISKSGAIDLLAEVVRLMRSGADLPGSHFGGPPSGPPSTETASSRHTHPRTAWSSDPILMPPRSVAELGAHFIDWRLARVHTHMHMLAHSGKKMGEGESNKRLMLALMLTHMLTHTPANAFRLKDDAVAVCAGA